MSKNKHQITIRVAQTHDSKALVSLWRSLDRLHAALHPRFFVNGIRDADKILNEIAKDSKRVLFVAEECKDLIGTVSAYLARPSQTMLRSDLRVYVDDLVVDPNYRRQGVGEMLMMRVKQWATSKDAVEIMLTLWANNTEAEALYQKLGYRAISQNLSLRLDS